ncbi:hypothetical protein ACTGJ9_016380 [Bradyrhizobium sp. RDM12]
MLIEINETLSHLPQRAEQPVDQLDLHQQSFCNRQPKRVDGSHVDKGIEPCGKLHRTADIG